uniref:Uncharacterized protein n=1 Tax=Branchiostoma floridae TaxID=7739 RepID=C3Y3E2_BRAFL|eukprot:XP_002609199.1 hypothetical protein BRAFLDRAFT_90652 [Branchiostoma floridae]
MASSHPEVEPVLIVHGGAGPIVKISQTRVDSKLKGVKDAGKAGYKTDHCMLVGVGANLFARQMGFPLVPTEELVREEHRKDAREHTKYTDAVTELLNPGKDEYVCSFCAILADSKHLLL